MNDGVNDVNKVNEHMGGVIEGKVTTGCGNESALFLPISAVRENSSAKS